MTLGTKHELYAQLERIYRYVQKTGDGITHSPKLIQFMYLICLNRPILLAEWDRQPVITMDTNSVIAIECSNGTICYVYHDGTLSLQKHRKKKK
jgi:hypothetical protein